MQARGKLETTVEIQVLVECQETFQVLDAETGLVLQGSADGAVQTVWHLACFETTVVSADSDHFPYLTKSPRGNFQLTNIDDLLGPKTWYHGDIKQ